MCAYMCACALLCTRACVLVYLYVPICAYPSMHVCGECMYLWILLCAICLHILCFSLSMYTPICTYLCCVCTFVCMDVDVDVLMLVCTRMFVHGCVYHFASV